MNKLGQEYANGKTRAECWYADIIKKPRCESKMHARMSLYDRALQFAPFSALTEGDEAQNDFEQIEDLLIDLGHDGMEW